MVGGLRVGLHGIEYLMQGECAAVRPGAPCQVSLKVRTIHPHVELVSVKVIDTAVVAFTVFHAQVDCQAPAPVLLPV